MSTTAGEGGTALAHTLYTPTPQHAIKGERQLFHSVGRCGAFRTNAQNNALRERILESPADITIVTWRAVDETDIGDEILKDIYHRILIDIPLKRCRGTMSREYSAGRTSCVE